MGTDTLLNLKVKVDSGELQELISSTKNASEQIKKTWADANKEDLQKYKEYISAKKTLDSQSKVSFEEYEKAKTIVEEAENDKRLQSYIQYKDKEEEKTLKSLENTKKLGNRLTLTLTAPLTAVAGLSLKAASKIEDFTASFKTLLGSEPKAKQMIKTINEMASTTPFDPDPLILSTEKLLAFGIEAENVNDVLRMLGDSSKGSAEALQTLSTAYGKVAAKGKASMEELNMMIDRGVPILGELSKVLGVAEDEVIKMVSSGKVGFNELNQAFKNMTSEGGVFFKGMETASQTLSGKLSTLKGNISLLGASLVEEVLPVIKQLVDFANNAVVSWQNMGQGAKTAILSIGSGLAVVGPSLKVITSVSTGIINLAKGLKTATTAQAAFNLVCKANPYVLLASALLAVGTALAIVISRTKSCENTQKKLQETITKIKTTSDNYVQSIKKMKDAEEDWQKTLAKEDLRKKRNELKATYQEITNHIKELQNNDREDMSVAQKNAEIAKLQYERKRMLVDLTKQLIELEGGVNLKNEQRASILRQINSLSKNNRTDKEILSEAIEEINKELEKQKQIEFERKKAEEDAEKARLEAEEAKKDGYQKSYEAYQKYEENKRKLDSGLLDNKWKNELNAQNETLKRQHDGYKKYLDRKNKEDAEIARQKSESEKKSEEAKQVRLKAQQQDLLKSNATSIAILLEEQKKYNNETVANAQKRSEIEHKLSELQADDLKELLVEMSANGEKLEGDLLNVYNLFFEIEKKAVDSSKNISNSLFEEAETIKGIFEKTLGYIKSDFQALTDDVLNKFLVTIANTFGEISKASTKLIDSFAGLQKSYDGLNESQSKTVNALKTTASALEFVGECVRVVAQAMSSCFQGAIQQIEKDLQGVLSAINTNEEKTYSMLEEQKKARLELLKDEYAQRGIIIETGYETELQKAQEAYENALALYEEYKEQSEEQICEELELYKEALKGKTDEEIQSALQAKELELQKTKITRNEEQQRIVIEKKAEVDKQKILYESEKEKLKTEYEANLARVNAENKSAEEKHKAETDAFYANMAMQIAQVWINVATGTVAAWAQSIAQLGPVAGAVTAGILTGVLAGLGGAQTGVIASQQPPTPPTYQALPVPPAFAEGVTNFEGGVALVGEKGPELVNLPKGSNVITNENTNNILQALAERNDGEITINVSCYIDSSQIPIKKQLLEIQRSERYRSSK